MKKFNLIIILIIIVLTNSCSPKENYNNLNIYEIVNLKELVFTPDTTKNSEPYDFYRYLSTIFDYRIIDGTETLIIPVSDKNDENLNDLYKGLFDPDTIKHKGQRLAFYDISVLKEYHSIQLLEDRDIINFNFINKDSIFVFYKSKPVNYNEYEDIYIQLINYEGESKICDYDIDISNFKESIDLRTPFTIQENIVSDKGNVYFTTETGSIGNIGTKSYIEGKQIPLFAYYDSRTDKIKISKIISFPDISGGVYYNTYHPKIHYCLSENNLPLLRFFYSGTLYEWDYKNDKITKHQLKSRIIDSIKPLKNENSLPESLEAVYGNILYDNYNKMYYSFLHLNNILYGNYYTLLILADKDFKYIGEILNPPMGSEIKIL